MLGEAADGRIANSLIREWREPTRVKAALSELRKLWKQRLGAVQIKTPDPAFDLMVNQWLPYQNLSCRILARGAFYQAGGAFGFRDQLQDVLVLLFSDPDRARAHILRAARHQFEEGDALHWWHPPSGRGVRTRCSDDYLWLVYVTARYVAATNDRPILDEEVPFLSAPELRPEEYDRYARFDEGAAASLFEHCARALDRMMTVGRHGLPLIGTGDWTGLATRARAKAFGWPGSRSPRSACSRLWRTSRGPGNALIAGGGTREKYAPPLQRTPGTATGTSVHSMMKACRGGPDRTRNAGST